MCEVPRTWEKLALRRCQNYFRSRIIFRSFRGVRRHHRAGSNLHTPYCGCSGDVLILHSRGGVVAGTVYPTPRPARPRHDCRHRSIYETPAAISLSAGRRFLLYSRTHIANLKARDLHNPYLIPQRQSSCRIAQFPRH